MNATFTPLAQSSAGYYCKGSPIHFDMVELFRLENTGDTVVTLTFKNLYSQPVQNFIAHYVCKDKTGMVLIEDDFTYENVNAGQGEYFGSDEAVCVSEDPLGSVEVSLVGVMYGDEKIHNLTQCTPVALPKLRPLPVDERVAVRTALNYRPINYYPQEAPDGWRCGCGAFNYNAGDARYTCSDCGVDKAVLVAAVQEVVRQQAGQRRTQYDQSMQFLPISDDET